jgi:hypothetical protein
VPELIEFELGTGGSVAIEVGPGAGLERVGRGGGTVRDVRASFEEALGDVRDAAAAALAQFQQMPTKPDEVEIAFGVKFDAQAGAIIARAGVEGNLQVTVKWARPRPPDPAPGAGPATGAAAGTAG